MDSREVCYMTVVETAEAPGQTNVLFWTRRV